jgi:hypothetical protein
MLRRHGVGSNISSWQSSAAPGSGEIGYGQEICRFSTSILRFSREREMQSQILATVASQAKKAHEFMWYHIKDPDQFKLKPPRRWDPSGLEKHAPWPFYNREDGHLLLNNTCTIANLCLLPELPRLQCYFFSKLPKIRKERNFWLPMKKVRTHSFRCIHMRC